MNFNKIGKNMIQIFGNCNGVIVSGIAFTTNSGIGYDKWNYDLIFFIGSVEYKIKTNVKDCTMRTEKALRERIEREINEIKNEKIKI